MLDEFARAQAARGAAGLPGAAHGSMTGRAVPLVLDDPLEGVPWAGPARERPDYYQSRYEQLLHALDYSAPPPRAAHEDEE